MGCYCWAVPDVEFPAPNTPLLKIQIYGHRFSGSKRQHASLATARVVNSLL